MSRTAQVNTEVEMGVIWPQAKGTLGGSITLQTLIVAKFKLTLELAP